MWCICITIITNYKTKCISISYKWSFKTTIIFLPKTISDAIFACMVQFSKYYIDKGLEFWIPTLPFFNHVHFFISHSTIRIIKCISIENILSPTSSSPGIVICSSARFDQPLDSYIIAICSSLSYSTFWPTIRFITKTYQ